MIPREGVESYNFFGEIVTFTVSDLVIPREGVESAISRMERDSTTVTHVIPREGVESYLWHQGIMGINRGSDPERGS